MVGIGPWNSPLENHQIKMLKCAAKLETKGGNLVHLH